MERRNFLALLASAPLAALVPWTQIVRRAPRAFLRYKDGTLVEMRRMRSVSGFLFEVPLPNLPQVRIFDVYVGVRVAE